MMSASQSVFKDIAMYRKVAGLNTRADKVREKKIGIS
jgi:hypothetical protein